MTIAGLAQKAIVESAEPAGRPSRWRVRPARIDPTGRRCLISSG